MEEIRKLRGRELEAVDDRCLRAKIINTYVAEARLHIAPAIEADAATVHGIIGDVEDQRSVLIYAERGADGFDGDQVILILAVDEIIFRDNRMHPIDYPHNSSICSLTVHRKAVVMVGIDATEDDPNRAVIG